MFSYRFLFLYSRSSIITHTHTHTYSKLYTAVVDAYAPCSLVFSPFSFGKSRTTPFAHGMFIQWCRCAAARRNFVVVIIIRRCLTTVSRTTARKSLYRLVHVRLGYATNGWRAGGKKTRRKKKNIRIKATLYTYAYAVPIPYNNNLFLRS